jgi:hypothetical protein
VCLNTAIQLQNQPKVAEQEIKSPLKRASEAIYGQRHSFLLTAAAQAPFVQRFLNCKRRTYIKMIKSNADLADAISLLTRSFTDDVRPILKLLKTSKHQH